jgi:Cu+-exporting ATPase
LPYAAGEMNESDGTRLDLPLAGMTCAACAARIEKVLNRLPGVDASVNLAAERARVQISGSETTPAAVLAAIERVGFSVPPQTIELAIEGMTCAACAARIEKVLNRLDGVEASVNLASERARVRFVAGLMAPGQLVAAIEKAGFRARVADDRSREEEKARKLVVYQAELRRFRIAAALTLPLLLQMFWMFSSGDMAAHGADSDPIPRWLQFLLATPVQFWIGWRFYDGAWKALRGWAVPTWTCWWRSAPAWPGVSRLVVTLLGLELARLFRGFGGGDHAGPARQAARGAGQGRHRRDRSADTPAAATAASSATASCSKCPPTP